MKTTTSLKNELPSLRWFKYQREGVGLESLVYTFIRLAKYERVEQWGFDDKFLNGVATLNQWCRNKEGGELVIITMECAGLLPGSSSAMVAERVRLTWEQGQHLLELDLANALVSLTNGGIVSANLLGVTYDTCNAAKQCGFTKSEGIAERHWERLVWGLRKVTVLVGMTFSAAMTRVTYISTRTIEALRRIYIEA